MTEGNGMLVRLGNVLYWSGTGVAVLFILAGIYYAVPAADGVGDKGWGYYAVRAAGSAIVAWLIGRAARYVLAGK